MPYWYQAGLTSLRQKTFVRNLRIENDIHNRLVAGRSHDIIAAS
jgi:hypothetical protein